MARWWILPILLFAGPIGAQQTFYVATTGVDTPAGGTLAAPWATITYALDRVPDQSTILVRPGQYTGRIRIRGNFPVGVSVRSELPYQARLRAAEAVLTIYNDNADIQGITIEGFDIAHSGAGAAALVVQIQDGFATQTSRITLRDNILHDSFNNDILKINNGASQIRVVGNLFYNQSGSDEHIDINSVDDVIVEDNVFFNDFAASGRPNANDTSSYVVVKDSNGGDDEYLGARNVVIRRNVFLNWQGSTGSGFLLFGEDGTANFEVFDSRAENNLLLGNAANTMRSPLGVKGSRDLVFRHNTVLGNLPANAYATRINREGDNPPIEAIRFAHNAFADGAGTMTDFSDTLPADLSTVRPSTLVRNAYWNAGSALPHDPGDMLNISGDATRVTADPLLPDPATVPTPWWNPAQNQFNGGHARIRDAFVALVEAYARPAAGSALIGAATAGADVPPDDILGRPRPANGADLGCYEVQSADGVFANGFE
ncbi:MAG: hypothetical protein OMOMHJEC_03045 [Xanthomonadales bacterium]|nr:hypothetical protein [Xanthomonadales bacterium]